MYGKSLKEPVRAYKCYKTLKITEIGINGYNIQLSSVNQILKMDQEPWTLDDMFQRSVAI